MSGAPIQRANTSASFSAVSKVSTLYASASQASLRADSAGTRGRSISWWPCANPERLQGSKEYASIYRKLATVFTWGQDFTCGLSSSCLACGLSAFGAHLPSVNDQVSNLLLPAQPWQLPGNAGWAACLCKNRTGKSKRYYDANTAYFTFTRSFECSQLLLVKSNFLSPPFDFFIIIISNADICSFVLLP